MKDQILIMSIFLFVSFQNSTAQVLIKDLDLKKIHKKELYQILHSKSDFNDDEAQWNHWGKDSTSYYLHDTVILINSNHYFYPNGKFCYLNTWHFVDVKKNYLNISFGAYLCKEPPGGGVTTFDILTIDRLKKRFVCKYLK